MHCRPTYKDSMRCIMPSHQEENFPSCHMGPIHGFCIIRIISLLFAIILIISDIKIGKWVHIHCRKLANQHIRHRESASIQTKSIRDSIINLQRAVSYDFRFRNLPIGTGLADVLQPSCTQFRFELIPQSINTCGNGCAFSCQTWLAIPRSILTCKIINIISIICLINRYNNYKI